MLRGGKRRFINIGRIDPATSPIRHFGEITMPDDEGDARMRTLIDKLKEIGGNKDGSTS